MVPPAQRKPPAGEGRGWIGFWSSDSVIGDSASGARALTLGRISTWYSITLWDTDACISAACQNRATEPRWAVTVAIAGDRAVARDNLAAEATAIWVGVAHARVIVRVAIERVRAALLTLALSAAGAGAPGAEQEEQVLHANDAVHDEVGETISLLRARSPGTEQEEQVLHANVAAGVEVRRAGIRRETIHRAKAHQTVVEDR